ncbi:putative Transcriptional regulator, TetR family [Mesorhizobium metallidurans STM 2683]|uniref:Putative Transcriptional regulator, TetR family n=2 Tax=Mesorhizobium metallidurans TaxID=489722 RepID=M5EUJ3_9HYPH|nr:putative Transcriptional regulator, TetR family [Mesorhizobium metallidurans STM 2683]
MPEVIDRRAARTRKALHHALLSLMLRKSYEAVSVQDIIDEADVGRSTFYAHYTGKEDLLRNGFQMLRAELRDAQSAARTKDDGSKQGPLSFSSAMFEHAGRYADHYRIMAGGRGGLVAENEIRQVLSEMVREDLSMAPDSSTIPREFVVQFVVSAFITALNWWFERRPKLTPAQIDGIFRDLALGGLSSLVGGERRIA